MKNIGTRKEVMKREAKQTGGGLKIDDLMYNKYGKIVSKKMSNKSTKKYKLQYNNLLIGGSSNFDFELFEEESKLEELERHKQLKNIDRVIDKALNNNVFDEESKLERQNELNKTERALREIEDFTINQEMEEREDRNWENFKSINPSFSIQSRKLRRQNTNIHNNKYGNCYMFASFSLINNIKNNIEKDGDWININIETYNNLMIILFFIYIIYYRFNKLQNQKLVYPPMLSFTNFLNMLYELSYKIINFLPSNYIDRIKELLEYNNNKLSNFFIDKKSLDINYIKKYIKLMKKNKLEVGLDINDNILDEFITKISFLSRYKLYSINNNGSINKSVYRNNIEHHMNINKNIEKNRIFIDTNLFEESDNIDNILYKILQTNQFIQIGFYTTKSDMDEMLKMAENTKMGNLISIQKQIIKTIKRRSLLNHNQTDIGAHVIVITDIIKDAKGDPILINNCYVYRFKNNWGEKWHNKGYGYCTLQSFNISEICFFIDNENSKEIDTLINSILFKKIYTTIVAQPNNNHSKKSLNVAQPDNNHSKKSINVVQLNNNHSKKSLNVVQLNNNHSKKSLKRIVDNSIRNNRNKKELKRIKKKTLYENTLDNEINLLKYSGLLEESDLMNNY